MERITMGGVDKIDRMKGKVISNLSKDKLKKYIFYLTRKYYETYMAKDEKGFNETIETLMEVIGVYRETYINLMGFIYYSLYLNAVLIISEKTGNDEFALKNIAKYDLMEDDEFEEELSHDMRNIFNKDRVRRRYFEKGINQSIE